MTRLLVLGGARSGKSRYAQQRVEACAGRLAYIATAQPLDAEMEDRIVRHRADRDARWHTIEAPLALAAAIARAGESHTAILVDCLTLWLSNLLFAGQAATQAEAGEAIDCPLFRAHTASLIDALPSLPGRIILVSNEVGWGVVPMHPVSRLFTDEQGRLNQRVAAVCDQVTLVAAGLPLQLKPR